MLELWYNEKEFNAGRIFIVNGVAAMVSERRFSYSFRQLVPKKIGDVETPPEPSQTNFENKVMADIEQFKKLTQAMREAVRQKLPDIAETVTLSAKALAERQIKDKGFAEVYSSTQVPAFFLYGKELNNKGKKFLEDHGVSYDGKQGEGKKKRRKEKEDADPGTFDKTTNWGEFRQAQGLQNMFVDLSYSNKMWANMQPVRTEVTDDLAVSFLGATNREAQNKMNWNRDRYGDFISKALTEEHGKLLGEIVVDALTDILNDFKK